MLTLSMSRSSRSPRNISDSSAVTARSVESGAISEAQSRRAICSSPQGLKRVRVGEQTP